MEKKESLEKGDLVNELVEGRDLTKKLQLMILGNEPPRSSYSCNNEDNNNDNDDKVYGLAQNILAKFERSLQILQYDPKNNQSNNNSKLFQQTTMDSPFSFSGSPKSQDDYNGDFKCPFDLKNDPKKLRRVIPQVTQKVQGCTKNGLEGPIEDGFNWRKYGQKDILGSKYPRAYFRCNQRSIEGCFATKFVQRSEDDPAFFQVTYRDKHTCSKASSIPNKLTQKPESSMEIIAYPTTLLVPNYNTNYVSDCSFSTSMFQSPQSSVANIINFNYHQNETFINNPHGAIVRDVTQPSLDIASSSSAPPLWFDLGEFDVDFFIN